MCWPSRSFRLWLLLECRNVRAAEPSYSSPRLRSGIAPNPDRSRCRSLSSRRPGPALAEPPLVSFIQKVPLRRLLLARPLPDAGGQALLHPSASWSHPADPVPSSWSLTTSTVCSALGAAGLLHPALDHGVRCVSSLPPALPPVSFRSRPSSCSASALSSRSDLSDRRPFPAALVTPSKAFPSPPAASCHLRLPGSRVAPLAPANLRSPGPARSCLLRFQRHRPKPLSPQVPLTIPTASASPSRSLPFVRCHTPDSDRTVTAKALPLLPLAPGACPDLARHP